MNGRLIKKFREAANMKRSTLANELGIDVSTLQRIETDQLTITTEKLYQISKILNLSIVEFFEEEHLYSKDRNQYDAYGKSESIMIKYLKVQIIMEQRKYDELIKSNHTLQNNIAMLNDNFKRLMNHFDVAQIPTEKTKKKSKSKSKKQ
jgi:transcriptional regulator with XRE-family HTH domain